MNRDGNPDNARFKLNPEFRVKLFNLALEREGRETQVGRRLGYKVAKGRRFRELRDGITHSISYQQLEIVSEITGIPLDEIFRHATRYKRPVPTKIRNLRGDTK